MLIVYWLTFSGKYFLYIQDENKSIKIINIRQKWGREGGTTGAMTFDCHWKSMESWVGTKLSAIGSWNNVATLFRSLQGAGSMALTKLITYCGFLYYNLTTPIERTPRPPNLPFGDTLGSCFKCNVIFYLHGVAPKLPSNIFADLLFFWTNEKNWLLIKAILVVTKDYEIGICCFSAKHAALRRKSKDWLARNQNIVSEWSDMSTRRLLFQWASTIKIQLSMLV
jgi:hypothetical protein